MNCEECKNKILEGNEKLCQKHIKKCKECQSFLETINFLKKTEKKLQTPNTTFKDIIKIQKKHKNELKKLLLTAASILLAINIFFYFYKPYKTKIENIKIVSENIDDNFNIIEETLGAMEDNIGDDTYINDEINIISEQINFIS